MGLVRNQLFVFLVWGAESEKVALMITKAKRSQILKKDRYFFLHIPIPTHTCIWEESGTFGCRTFGPGTIGPGTFVFEVKRGTFGRLFTRNYMNLFGVKRNVEQNDYFPVFG